MSEVCEPVPTHRAVIDPLRRCGLKCAFCYYRHSGDTSSVRPWNEVQQEIDAAKARGNEWLDITGGEPMLYPEIAELVRYAHQQDLQVRIITSCIVPNTKLLDVLEARVDDWLISMHGLRDTHDRLVGHDGAREQQERWLAQIGNGFCINYVIVRDNQHELAPFARYLRRWKPRIVNFIQFNPHHAWRQHPESQKFVADLSVVGPQLNEAIDYLEEMGCGVNVRYYPMCRIRADLRRCVCNDLHVAFDSGEWDYWPEIPEKTFDAHWAWGIRVSQRTEEKGQPCCACDLQEICGGANRFWHAVARELYGEPLLPANDPRVERQDFYRYRRLNARGMA
jgi:MoaA/NifB/PqqE/SkfB family radical SAM enzyme